MPEPNVTVLANPDCPHCVRALDHYSDWAVEEGASIASVDLPRHPEAAQRFHYEASPTLVFAHEGRPPDIVAGAISHDEFRRRLHGG